MLLWVYLVWVVVLLGAVVAAYAPSLQMQVISRPAVPGWRFELAMAVLSQLDRVRHSAPHGLSQAALSERLRADPLQLEPVLELLQQIGWVSRLDESGDARHVLLCDASTTTVGPLLQCTLLDPGASSAAFVSASGMQGVTLRQALGT